MSEPSGMVKNESSPLLEEGMYYEKVFGPEKVRVMFNELLDTTKIVFEDKNGQSLEVADPRLVSRVLMYYAKYTEFKSVAELRKLAPDVLQQALNTAIGKRNRDLKAMYDEQGRLQGIASTMHEQVSWAKVREVVEAAIREVAGDVSKLDRDAELPFKWTYGLPVKNENVSGWVGVHAGNNIIKGHSAIKVFSRWRTERFDDRGGVRRPACLNWCGMWQFPEQFFKVPMKRLDSIAKIVGQEQVKNIAMMQFHIKPDMEAFKEELKTGLAGMIRTMEKIQPVIDKSIHSPLSKVEMERILLAYQTRGKSYIPDYIVEQVMAHVDEETVWGFSQAVSWVRTHGDFKFVPSTNAMFKPVEERDLTWRLENVAGEVLSLTLTINDIHKKHGQITLEFLVGEEQAKTIREAKIEKAAKQKLEAPEIVAEASAIAAVA
jgi:hypothetical protein